MPAQRSLARQGAAIDTGPSWSQTKRWPPVSRVCTDSAAAAASPGLRAGRVPWRDHSGHRAADNCKRVKAARLGKVALFVVAVVDKPRNPPAAITLAVIENELFYVDEDMIAASLGRH